MMEQVKFWIVESSKDKNPYLRALLLIWSFHIANYILHNQDPPGWLNPLWTISHGIHEIGHWVAISLLHTAHYAGSAAYSALEMITPHYITLYHDWVWMLSQLDAIHHAEKVENFFYSLSVFTLFASIGGQVGTLCLIWKSRYPSKTSK